MSVSETVSKKRRGRPRLLEGDALILANMTCGSDATERTRQNHYYRAIGLGFVFEHVDDHPELLWLADRKKMEAGGPGSKQAWKPTILTELGRLHLEAPEWSLEVAREVCKEKHSRAVDRVRFIRGVRKHVREESNE